MPRETYRQRGARAAAVTRALRKADFVILPSGTPRSREGVRVEATPYGSATVVVSLDSPGRRARITEAVTEALQVAGYAVKPNAGAPYILNVTREG